MDFFSDSLSRLKHYLRVSKDQEVAAALGISKTAFSERKKRNSFPEKELRALAQQRPELGIDVEYVLTGGVLSPRQRQNIEGARQFTLALQGVNEAERAHLLGHNAQAARETAATNARREEITAQATELLNAYSDDETAELALLLLVKLYKAGLVESKKAA